MTPGIFGRTYPLQPLDQLFARIRRDGFEAVQFNLSCAGLPPLPAELPPGLAQDVAVKAKAAALSLCALSGTYNMAHPDEARRRADRQGFANVMAAAAAMGVRRVTLCTGSRDPSDMWRAHADNTSPDAWSAMRAEVDYALGLAERLDLALAIEPEPGNVVADATLARRLLDEVGNRRLGIILDAANLLPPPALSRQATIVAEAMDLLGPDLMLVHAKDVDRDGHVKPAGLGAVDLPAFVAQVRAAGYDGPLVGHGFTEDEAPAVARVLSGLIAGASA